ncbi:ferredoxin:glutaredoxin reductase [bacterium]|nr:ferredoxin:glutaredoxin reductase [bacterium]
MTNRPALDEVEKLYERLESEAQAGGYFLNPDEEFTRDLIEALLINTERYGYQSCPCRLAKGIRDQDLDIICPCDYRDPDLAEFGSCYCALYVSGGIADGKAEAVPIPERRPSRNERSKKLDAETRGRGDAVKNSDGAKELDYPVWRCPVCGYLCAREHPPESCPICKADKDRFKRFM